MDFSLKINPSKWLFSKCGKKIQGYIFSEKWPGEKGLRKALHTVFRLQPTQMCFVRKKEASEKKNTSAFM